MKRSSRRGIAIFAKIQAKKPVYMIKRKTNVDLYTEAYEKLLKGAEGHDKIIG